MRALIGLMAAGGLWLSTVAEVRAQYVVRYGTGYVRPTYTVPRPTYTYRVAPVAPGYTYAPSTTAPSTTTRTYTVPRVPRTTSYSMVGGGAPSAPGVAPLAQGATVVPGANAIGATAPSLTPSSNYYTAYGFPGTYAFPTYTSYGSYASPGVGGGPGYPVPAVTYTPPGGAPSTYYQVGGGTGPSTYDNAGYPGYAARSGVYNQGFASPTYPSSVSYGRREPGGGGAPAGYYLNYVMPSQTTAPMPGTPTGAIGGGSGYYIPYNH